MGALPDYFPDYYEVLEELGRASTGVVYKARCKRWNRLVALKTIIPVAGEAGDIQRVRFLRECRAMAACRHSGAFYRQWQPGRRQSRDQRDADNRFRRPGCH